MLRYMFYVSMTPCVYIYNNETNVIVFQTRRICCISFQLVALNQFWSRLTCSHNLGGYRQSTSYKVLWGARGGDDYFLLLLGK